MPRTRRVWSASFNASFGGFLYGYNIAAFNVAQENVAYTLGWGDETELLISVGTGLLLFGGLIGSAFSGYIANYSGRRNTLLFTDIISVIGAVLTSIPTTPTMIMGRFVSGLGIGAFMTIVPIYVSEISPPSISGQTGSIFGFQIPFGLAAGSLIGLVLPESPEDDGNDFWILLFAAQLIVLIPQALFLLFKFKADTPHWYLQHNDPEAADWAMRELGRDDPLQVLEGEPVEARRNVSLLQFFCSKKYSKVARVGTLCALSNTFSGITFFDTYSTYAFHKVGYSMVTSRLLTGLSTLPEFIGVLIGFLTINRIGRKKLYLGGLSVITIALACICIFVDIHTVPLLIIIFSFIYKAAVAVSIGSIVFLYISEIMNSKEVGIVNIFAFVADAVVGFTSLYTVSAIGLAGNFGIYCVLAGVTTVYMTFDMLETSHKSRDQIELMYVGAKIANKTSIPDCSKFNS